MSDVRKALAELEAAARVICTFDCSRHMGPPQRRDMGCNMCVAFDNLEKATKRAGDVLRSGDT
jgi:hypothetical protein